MAVKKATTPSQNNVKNFLNAAEKPHRTPSDENLNVLNSILNIIGDPGKDKNGNQAGSIYGQLFALSFSNKSILSALNTITGSDGISYFTDTIVNPITEAIVGLKAPYQDANAVKTAVHVVVDNTADLSISGGSPTNDPSEFLSRFDLSTVSTQVRNSGELIVSAIDKLRTAITASGAIAFGQGRQKVDTKPITDAITSAFDTGMKKVNSLKKSFDKLKGNVELSVKGLDNINSEALQLIYDICTIVSPEKLSNIDTKSFVQSLQKLSSIDFSKFNFKVDKDMPQNYKDLMAVMSSASKIIQSVAGTAKENVKFLLISDIFTDNLKSIATGISGWVSVIPDVDRNALKPLSYYVDDLKDIFMLVSSDLVKPSIKILLFDKLYKSSLETVKSLVDTSSSIVGENFNNDSIQTLEKYVTSLNKIYDDIASLKAIKMKSAAKALEMFINSVLPLIAQASKDINKISKTSNIERTTVIKNVIDVVIESSKIGWHLVGLVLAIVALKVFNGAVLPEIIKSIDKIKGIDSSKETDGVVGAVDIVTKVTMRCALIGLLLPGMMLAVPALAAVQILIIPIISNILKQIEEINDSDAASSIASFTEIVSALTKLVVVSAAVMMVGGLFMMIPKLAIKSLEFSVVLATFIFLTVGAYRLTSKGISGELAAASSFAKLVAISATTMLIGAMVLTANPNLALRAVEFGVVLGVFILSVSLAYRLGSKGSAQELAAASQFAILVAVSGTIMLLAASILDDKHVLGKLLGFSIILGVFILSVVGAYKLAMSVSNASTMIKDAIALSIVIAISGTMMLIAASVLEDKKNIIFKLLGFSLALTLLVGSVGLTCQILGSMGSQIIKGALIMTGVIAIIALSTIVFNMVNATVEKFGGVGKMFGVMTGFIGALLEVCLGTAAFGLTSLIPTFWVGVAAMGALSLVMLQSARSMKELSEFISSDGTLTAAPMLEMIDVYKQIADYLEDKFSLRQVPGIRRATRVMTKLSNLIHRIAVGVKEYANMECNVYDDNGKCIGKRKLSSSDFRAAADNVSIIINTLGDAVIKAYEKNPEMFKSAGKSIADIINGGGKTPFELVIRGAVKMGKMISGIVSGVLAFLKGYPVAWDKNGKPIRFKEIGENEIMAVSYRISNIIDVLGDALLITYNKNPKLFQVAEGFTFAKLINGGGKTPFEMVLRGASKLGSMISSIAQGVSVFAQGYPVAWNKDGKPIKFEKFDDKTISRVKVTVNSIIKTLSDTIKSIYDNDTSGLFEIKWSFAKIINGGGKTLYEKVIQSTAKLGDMIGNLAEGVVAIGSITVLGIPKYNSEGKIVGYTKVPSDFFTTAASNVKTIITTVAGAIDEEIQAHPEWFKVAWWRKSEADSTTFGRGVICMSMLGQLVANMSKAIIDYSKWKITDKDGNVLELNATTLKMVGDNIGMIINCIATAVYDAFTKGKNTKQMLKLVGTNSESSPVMRFAKSIAEVSNTITAIIDTYTKMAEADIPNGATLSAKVNGLTDAFYTNLTLFKGADLGNGKIAKFNADDVVSDIKSKLKVLTAYGKLVGQYSDITKDLVKISKRLESVDSIVIESKLTSVFDMIENNVDGMAEKDSTKFKENLAATKELIQSVDGVKLEKLNAVSNFAAAISKLSESLQTQNASQNNFLQKFMDIVETVGEEVAMARAVMDVAENVQSKRSSIITKSIQQINAAVAKPIMVNVKSVPPDPAETGGVEGEIGGSAESYVAESGSSNLSVEEITRAINMSNIGKKYSSK